ncbi:MAG TPA: hypothetical protein EYN07_00855 [Flavobacteriaceae bacterium]|jgi:hypothetical protein|nr:hypothetical protein [Flavobacteriaceae bacterium]HIN97765.1 hypothetical protein [Flavobacteriaceae bacterium]|tara:strand:+ start:12281 stop:13096 length:816 start_codon:yes stop_codon:yes gene_type:complete
MKLLLTSCLLLLTFVSFSQTIERTLVEGTIFVPAGDSADQVSVYNVSSQKGTVTDAEGNFTLAVAANDRVLISALQFQSFTVVVDEGVVAAKQMRIYMNPAINQLEEVVVRPYDLSGNINVDVNRVDVYASPNWDLSYETLEYEYEFTEDRQTSIKGNVAEDALNNGGLKNGFNFISVLGVIANAIVGKKKKDPYVETPNYSTIVRALQQRFSAQYYADTFGIPIEKVDNFIYFAQENAVTPEMLKEENEIELLATLFQQSEVYKERIKVE